MNDQYQKKEIWFIYDGECPLCNSAAQALKIKKDYGTLHLLDARLTKSHPLIEKTKKNGFDLDEGMVIFDGHQFYHGSTALNFMARYGDNRGTFNLLNKALFWSGKFAFITYPWMRGIRNLLLRLKKVPKIDNLNLKNEPIFKDIFGTAWNELPPVMHKHYANRPYTNDCTIVEGKLDVMCAKHLKLFSPFLWLLGGIPPHNEKDVPITVKFKSDETTKKFHFNREFRFRKRKPYHFRSSMIQKAGNEVIELMRFGLAWRMNVVWEDDRVKLQHKGYALHLFGHYLPLPLTLLLGEGNAEETAVDENTFDMFVDITHPLWGKIYEYKGRFEIKQVP